MEFWGKCVSTREILLLWVTQGHRQSHRSIERIEFLSHFMENLRLFCTVFERYSELFVESHKFLPPSMHLATTLGWPHWKLEFYQEFTSEH